MGCFSQDEPSMPNYAQQTTQTLGAQIKLAPQEFAAEAQYSPQYGNLSLENLNAMLNGSPGGTKNVTRSNVAGQTGWYDPTGQFVSPGDLQPPGWLAGLSGGRATYSPGNAPGAGDVWQNQGSTWDTTGKETTAATPGLTSLLAGANTAQRGSDISDVSRYGPSATAAMLAANPAQAELLGKLNDQANAGLDAGSSLTPDQARAMQQASRAAFAARGMAGSNMGISDELLRQFNLGQQLLQQRQGFAQSVMGNNQQIVGDPFQQIIGRSSGAVPLGQDMAHSAGPTLFNPDDAVSAQMTAGRSAYDAMFAAPSVMSDVGSAVGIFGKLVGGIAGGAGI